jgi:glyoxylase I family protein
MSIDHVLAVVPVSDMDPSCAWYECLFGHPADNHPMVTLAEWRVTDAGWVQVFLDPARAGSTLLNFAVDDLDTHLAELGARGLRPQANETANKGVRLSTLVDPDGNRITLIGNFRTTY